MFGLKTLLFDNIAPSYPRLQNTKKSQYIYESLSLLFLYNSHKYTVIATTTTPLLRHRSTATSPQPLLSNLSLKSEIYNTATTFHHHRSPQCHAAFVTPKVVPVTPKNVSKVVSCSILRQLLVFLLCCSVRLFFLVLIAVELL